MTVVDLEPVLNHPSYFYEYQSLKVWNYKNQRAVLRVIDQIVNPREALLPEAEGWGQWWLWKVDNLICHPQHRAWLFLLHRKSIVHSPYLSLYFRPICKTPRREHELVHGFSNNSLPCKQMTTFSPLLLVSTQPVNVPLLQNEFAAKYR